MKPEQRQLPSYPLRLEPETRAKLEAIAKANGRSLHAEISMRLEASLQAEKTASASESADITIDEAKELINETKILIIEELKEFIQNEITKARKKG